MVEPAFNEAAIQQVVGRAVRQNSHTDPAVPKKVRVYRWISKLDPSHVDPNVADWRKLSADQVVFKHPTPTQGSHPCHRRF